MSDEFRYFATAAHLSAAIDALVNEAVLDETISELDVVRYPSVQLMMAIFERRDELSPGSDAKKGKRRRGRGSGQGRAGSP